MAKFVTDYLSQLIYDKDCVFKSDDYRYGGNDGSIVKIIGRIRAGLATFTITRCRLDGTGISSIPVFDMPLTKKTIDSIAELAVEAL